MAALCLSAQLKLKGDERKGVCVPLNGSLSSLRSGIKELNVKVSQLLTDLLQSERGAGEEDENKDEDGDEEAESDGRRPPAKRLKP